MKKHKQKANHQKRLSTAAIISISLALAAIIYVLLRGETEFCIFIGSCSTSYLYTILPIVLYGLPVILCIYLIIKYINKK